jgi:Rps23 Pro-64 3,4-dihydroxylase Tpa1-like proline 4-hydroxylase
MIEPKQSPFFNHKIKTYQAEKSFLPKGFLQIKLFLQIDQLLTYVTTAKKVSQKQKKTITIYFNQFF